MVEHHSLHAEANGNPSKREQGVSQLPVIKTARCALPWKTGGQKQLYFALVSSDPHLSGEMVFQTRPGLTIKCNLHCAEKKYQKALSKINESAKVIIFPTLRYWGAIYNVYFTC